MNQSPPAKVSVCPESATVRAPSRPAGPFSGRRVASSAAVTVRVVSAGSRVFHASGATARPSASRHSASVHAVSPARVAVKARPSVGASQ